MADVARSALTDTLSAAPTDYSKVWFGLDDLNDTKSKRLAFDILADLIRAKPTVYTTKQSSFAPPTANGGLWRVVENVERARNRARVI